MGEGAEAIKKISPRLLSQLHGQAPPDAKAPMAAVDHEGSDLGQCMAQRGQLSAGDDPLALGGDQKTAHMAFQLIELSWQKVSLLEMCLDETMNLPGLFGASRPDDRLLRLPAFSFDQLSRSHIVTPAST